MNGKRLELRLHAVRRMIERGIHVHDVEYVLETGQLIESYPDDTPYPSRLVLGWVGRRALHVVVADHEEAIIVITAYEPDPAEWEPGFRRRR